MSILTLRYVCSLGVFLGAFVLLTTASSTMAEPRALDESPPSKTDKDADADADKPKTKTSITVPSGTSMMIKTSDQVSSKDKAGRKFSATLQANLLAGDTVVAKQGSQVYGQVISSAKVGRGIVVQHSSLVLGLTDINIDGTMYPIQTGSFSENSTSAILRKDEVVVPAGSLLEFRLKQPLTVKK